jgi:arabinogalactan endo-1,4-beta-galactosidase
MLHPFPRVMRISPKAAIWLILLFWTTRPGPISAAEFMAGADVSALAVLEDHGAVYRDVGQSRDLIELFSDHGVNWFRLRLFVNPNGQDVVVNDLSYTLKMAHRIKAAGGNLLLDLHYSDTWADPGHQTKPAAWSSLSFTQLQQRVHDYTHDVMQAFSNEGVAPQMVQIGNEISNGMLWGDGYPWSGGSNNVGFDRLAALLNAGINGAKAGAASDEQPLIMLHHDRGAQWSTTSYYFNKLAIRDVDFDVIGYSYYPKWHYDPATQNGAIEDLQENLNNTATIFGKPVVVVETGFPSRGAQFEPQFEFPVSTVGQRQFLEAVVDAVQQVPNGLGWGAFWWYPEARPVEGLSVWEGGRYGWFDANGNLLPAINALGSLNPQPGDFNADGSVDAADLVTWQAQFGEISGDVCADGDSDGDVDGADFLIWQRKLNIPSTTAVIMHVPEPSSGVLLRLAIICVGATSGAGHGNRNPSR